MYKVSTLKQSTMFSYNLTTYIRAQHLNMLAYTRRISTIKCNYNTNVLKQIRLPRATLQWSTGIDKISRKTLQTEQDTTSGYLSLFSLVMNNLFINLFIDSKIIRHPADIFEYDYDETHH